MRIAKVKDGKVIATGDTPNGSLTISKKMSRAGWLPLQIVRPSAGKVKYKKSDITELKVTIYYEAG